MSKSFTPAFTTIEDLSLTPSGAFVRLHLAGHPCRRVSLTRFINQNIQMGDTVQLDPRGRLPQQTRQQARRQASARRCSHV